MNPAACSLTLFVIAVAIAAWGARRTIRDLGRVGSDRWRRVPPPSREARRD